MVEAPRVFLTVTGLLAALAILAIASQLQHSGGSEEVELGGLGAYAFNVKNTNPVSDGFDLSSYLNSPPSRAPQREDLAEHYHRRNLARRERDARRSPHSSQSLDDTDNFAWRKNRLRIRRRHWSDRRFLRRSRSQQLASSQHRQNVARAQSHQPSKAEVLNNLIQEGLKDYWSKHSSPGILKVKPAPKQQPALARQPAPANTAPQEMRQDAASSKQQMAAPQQASAPQQVAAAQQPQPQMWQNPAAQRPQQQELAQPQPQQVQPVQQPEQPQQQIWQEGQQQRQQWAQQHPQPAA